MAAYIVEMQKLARTCKFGDSLQENLRDSIAHGVRDENLKRKLFEDKTLTYRKLMEICSAWEETQTGLKVEKETIQVSGNVGGERQINRVRKTYHQNQNARENCKCCGKPYHTREKCRYRNCVCNYCSIKGHLESICWKKKTGAEKVNVEKSDKKKSGSFQNIDKAGKKTETSNRNKKVHNVETRRTGSDEDDDIFVRKLYSIRTISVESKKPTFLEVEVENVKLRMELDNGADISCINAELYEKEFKNCPLLETTSVQMAYDNHTFEMLGYITVNAKLQGNIASKLKLYVVKNGSHPLIGREWFEPLGIELSVKINAMKAVSESADDVIKKFTEVEFPDVFSEKLGRYKFTKASLVLREGAKPKYCRPRPLPFSIREKVTAELERLIKAGVLVPVKVSDWGTPIVPVGKSNGDVRVCGDYKITVNPELVVDRFPLPKIEDLFLQIADSEFFTTFDLAHAYQQIELDEDARKILTLSTLIGLLEPTVLMFGIASAPGIFQREIEKVMAGLECVASFLDDVIIGGKNFEHHKQLCREVLKRFRNEGLTINRKKCVFFKTTLKYLGFCVDKKGISMDPDKVEAIVKAPQPKTKKEVQAFIGMLAYVIKFIPNAAEVLRPLYDLIKKEAPEKVKTSEEIISALVKVKKLVQESTYLAHFDPNKPIVLRCDASPVGVGGVLLHIIDEEEVPIAYTSRTLSAAEKVYAEIDREALAIVYCVQKFDKYIYIWYKICVRD